MFSIYFMCTVIPPQAGKTNSTTPLPGLLLLLLHASEHLARRTARREEEEARQCLGQEHGREAVRLSYLAHDSRDLPVLRSAPIDAAVLSDVEIALLVPRVHALSEARSGHTVLCGEEDERERGGGTRRVSSCSARRERAVAKASPGVAGHKNVASLCGRRLLTHCTDPPCTPSRAEPCRRPLPSRRGTCSSSEASPSSASASASYARSAACAGLPGLDEAALCRLPNSCSENSARSQNPVHEKGRARQGSQVTGKRLKKYATEGDRLLLPLLADPPRLHLFLSVQRADSRRVAPAAHFYAANIFFTEVVTFLLASFFFLYSPSPS